MAWFNRPKLQFTQAELAATLRRTLGPCPHCGGALLGHAVDILMSTAADDDDALDRFLRCVEVRDFAPLERMRPWDPSKDGIELFRVRCPSGRLALVVDFSPYSPDLDDWVRWFPIASPEDEREVMALVSQEEFRL